MAPYTWGVDGKGRQIIISGNCQVASVISGPAPVVVAWLEGQDAQDEAKSLGLSFSDVMRDDRLRGRLVTLAALKGWRDQELALINADASC